MMLAVKKGFLFTYIAPLVFVLSVTMLKEAYDDFKRWRRDKEANSQKYERLTPSGMEKIPSSRIRVGDLIVIHTDQRVPADCILLRTTEKSGASFIRTDQLDGETDWKLRHAVPICQKARSDMQLINMTAAVYAERPKKEIYDFIGTFTRYNSSTGQPVEVDSLNLENTLWSNCVIASGTVVALVIYTGKETRSVMNTSSPTSKIGKLDMELNTISKFLFIFMCILSVLLVAMDRFQGMVSVPCQIYSISYLALLSTYLVFFYSEYHSGTSTSFDSSCCFRPSSRSACASTWIWAKRSTRSSS